MFIQLEFHLVIMWIVSVVNSQCYRP